MVTVSSNNQQEAPLSFFKVVRDPSAGHLALPNAFVRRYMEKIPKNPTLVTATGDHSWRMEFVKIGEDYCFAHGWDDLVKDVGLCARDVVVFWLIDSLTFQVCFLGSNGWEKYVPVNKTKDDDDDDDGVKDDDGEYHDDDEDEDMQDENLCFQKVLGRGSFRYMLLPIKFVKAAGLERKESVKLKDHEGKEWTMKITANGSVHGSACLKYCLSAGWAMFRNYHMFSEGDVCTFTFDKQEGIINLTKLFRAKRPIKQNSPMKEVNRNYTGTQSCYGDGNVKIEDQWSPTNKPCSSSAGVKVKTEYESGPEMEVVKGKRGTSPLKGCAEVKVEDGWVPETMVVKRKKGMAPPEKPSTCGRVEVNTEPRTESVFRSKRVVYF